MNNVHPESLTSKLHVRQTTNSKVVKSLMVINVIVYIFLWYLHDTYPETMPKFYIIGLFANLYLVRILVRLKTDPLESGDNLEFRRDPITLLIAGLLPTAIVYLLFTYAISVSSTVMVASYIVSVVTGMIIGIVAASHKVIVKEHVIVFIQDSLLRKPLTIPYKNIRQIDISSATDGITVFSESHSAGVTIRWMDNIDTLQKLIRQRVEMAQASGAPETSNLTLEELADLRVRGVMTDNEFNEEFQRRHGGTKS